MSNTVIHTQEITLNGTPREVFITGLVAVVGGSPPSFRAEVPLDVLALQDCRRLRITIEAVDD